MSDDWSLEEYAAWKAARRSTKPSNPKDVFGAKKVPMSCVSAPVMCELALGMLEGSLKYGRHNYRAIGVRASVYYDATMRHLMQWWEGEDIDKASGAELHHITKAIASLVVLRDAMIRDNCTDDRPPRTEGAWVEELNRQVEKLQASHPNPVAPYTEVDQSWVEKPE